MYSPRISEELIPALYKIAQSEQKPMTTLVSEMIRKELKRRMTNESKRGLEHGSEEV